MYKSFGVRCDVHTQRPGAGRSWLQVWMLLDLDALHSISG